eukprot:comp19028_c0_seq1/m.35157 comp19028_c0_seq1/g.35157  ORF comp19028_c0_seq1/g.35157 comp19028_c0_seq1/m.35157 type:complete len:309 (-) comp19028_c0_seq1:240-1166(-)
MRDCKHHVVQLLVQRVVCAFHKKRDERAHKCCRHGHKIVGCEEIVVLIEGRQRVQQRATHRRLRVLRDRRAQDKHKLAKPLVEPGGLAQCSPVRVDQLEDQRVHGRQILCGKLRVEDARIEQLDAETGDLGHQCALTAIARERTEEIENAVDQLLCGFVAQGDGRIEGCWESLEEHGHVLRNHGRAHERRHCVEHEQEERDDFSDNGQIFAGVWICGKDLRDNVAHAFVDKGLTLERLDAHRGDHGLQDAQDAEDGVREVPCGGQIGHKWRDKPAQQLCLLRRRGRVCLCLRDTVLDERRGDALHQRV